MSDLSSEGLLQRTLHFLANYGFSGDRMPEESKSITGPGLYVLRFDNGWLYVGQTINFARRFQNHLARFGRIRSFAWSSQNRDCLDQTEYEIISGLQTLGFRNLHNKTFMSMPLGPTSFDQLMSPEQQQCWAQGVEGVVVDMVRRSGLEDLRERNDRRLQILKAVPEWDNAVRIAGHYVRALVPALGPGEASFWSVSCAPYMRPGDSEGTLWRINIGWQEVAFADRVEEEGLYLFGFMSPSIIDDEFESDEAEEAFLASYSSFQWEDRFWPSGGGDQISFSIGIHDAEEFLSQAVVTRAIRRFNLGLSRKGKCVYSRSHCPGLADLMLGQK